jgi:hypothetical protein
VGSDALEEFVGGFDVVLEEEEVLGPAAGEVGL